MDIYQPVGDTLARRPLMMFAFGGGFLIGAKEDEDARALCDSFARKGFVTASINYRLGMNISDANSGERAVYRAVQDWSAAIRYLKEKSDSLRIDTNWVFAGGVSAGSISAMHCQYMSESERPASSFASGLPFPAPDLGCKDCSGNSFAHSSKVRPSSTLGEPSGTLPGSLRMKMYP
ncbi:MAG: alpha/beta hydrolase [Bacteroidetes bacterium]|nr:alpha/beta hydrolase [Bacteroidota bacterium]